MSTEVFARGQAREVLIWELPKINIFRAMGLSASLTLLTLVIPFENDRYLQDFYVIQENETIKYDHLIAVLVAELASINAERTITLANIATKRLEKSLQMQARAKKLDNMTFSNLVATALMDAQFDALREDQAQLLTKQQIVATAKIKARAEIEEIQSKIQLEGGNLLLAEIDVLKAQQDLVKKDIEILATELRLLNIALEVTETSLQIMNLVLEKVNIKADIRLIEADIKRTKLSDKHLTAERKEIRVELDGITRRLSSDLNLLTDKEAIVSNEVSDSSSYLTMLSTLLVTQIASEQMRSVIAAAYSANALAVAKIKSYGIAAPEAASRIADATLRSTTSAQLATQHLGIGVARVAASATENEAHIAAAIMRAKAEVTSTLTHTIGSTT